MLGEVEIYSPGLNGGVPFAKDANGNTINISASQTSGMQEAIDCAIANGWNLRRFGNSGQGGPAIDFRYSAGVALTGNPHIHKTTFSIHSADVTDFFEPQVPICWMVGTCSNFKIDRIASTIMTNPAGIGIDFNPDNGAPGVPNIGPMSVHLGFITGPGGVNTASAIRLRSTTPGAVGINAVKIHLDGFNGCSNNLQIIDPSPGCGSIDSNLFVGGIDHETSDLSPLGLAKNRFVVADSFYNQYFDMTPPSGSGVSSFTNNWFVPAIVTFNTGPSDAINFARLISPLSPSITPSLCTVPPNSSSSLEVPPGFSLSIGYVNSGSLSVLRIGK